MSTATQLPLPLLRPSWTSARGVTSERPQPSSQAVARRRRAERVGRSMPTAGTLRFARRLFRAMSREPTSESTL
eukprot:5449178-Alexandrium_andersonii.AAC.1